MQCMIKLKILLFKKDGNCRYITFVFKIANFITKNPTLYIRIIYVVSNKFLDNKSFFRKYFLNLDSISVNPSMRIYLNILSNMFI